ncbi:MAG: hypothetical protein LBK76_09870 [Verrucomicrobiales bacterium]|nr:hypothetical protein [Verrucomicrobiales bacterium]
MKTVSWESQKGNKISVTINDIALNCNHKMTIDGVTYTVQIVPVTGRYVHEFVKLGITHIAWDSQNNKNLVGITAKIMTDIRAAVADCQAEWDATHQDEIAQARAARNAEINRGAMRREYNRKWNEGGEGYNPYGSQPTVTRELENKGDESAE